jgi:hypothetical protein
MDVPGSRGSRGIQISMGVDPKDAKLPTLFENVRMSSANTSDCGAVISAN